MCFADSLFIAKLHDSGTPLTEADLAAFERELGSPLPADYREFLLLRNGGLFYEPMSRPLEGSSYTTEIGHFKFFRLQQPPEEVQDIRVILKMNQGRIPTRTVPIGEAVSDLLLLDLRPKTRGAIFLWVRDEMMPPNPEEDSIPVARSFAEFVVLCRSDPEGLSFSVTVHGFTDSSDGAGALVK